MTKLEDIAPEILSVATLLDNYLSMVAALRSDDQSERERARDVMLGSARRLSERLALLEIEATLPTEFDSASAVDEFILSTPTGLMPEIVVGLFKKHGSRATTLFHFASQINTLLRRYLPLSGDARKEITESALANGRILGFPADRIRSWLDGQLWDVMPEIEDHFVGTHRAALDLHRQSYDVFLSYAEDDAPLATAIREALESEGLCCFMAKTDVRLADRWEDSIRSALISSKRLVILLTPRSVRRRWVLLEIGAAWALGKPIVPVLNQVRIDRVMEPLRAYQARTVETPRQIDDFVQELRDGS
jgi:hypothetical protein